MKCDTELTRNEFRVCSRLPMFRQTETVTCPTVAPWFCLLRACNETFHVIVGKVLLWVFPIDFIISSINFGKNFASLARVLLAWYVKMYLRPISTMRSRSHLSPFLNYSFPFSLTTRIMYAKVCCQWISHISARRGNDSRFVASVIYAHGHLYHITMKVKKDRLTNQAQSEIVITIVNRKHLTSIMKFVW